MSGFPKYQYNPDTAGIAVEDNADYPKLDLVARNEQGQIVEHVGDLRIVGDKAEIFLYNQGTSNYFNLDETGHVKVTLT